MPLFLGALVFILLFQANEIIFLYKEYPSAKVPPLALLKYVLYRSPYFVSQALPMSIALAAGLVGSRLARESELTAMRSAGIPIRRVLFPVLIAGLIAATFDFFVVERLNPNSQLAARKLLGEVGMLNVNPSMATNKPIVLANGTLVYIQAMVRRPKDELELQGITLLERQADQLTITQAPQGTYRDGFWTLEDTFAVFLKGQNLLTTKSSGKTVINEKIEVEDLMLPPQAEEKSIRKLRESITQAKRTSAPLEAIRGLEINLWSRFSVPFACLVFTLTSTVISIFYARLGPSVGVIASLILVMIWFNLYIITTKILANTAAMPPFLAAFLPDIALVIFGFVMLRRVE